jgi:hypothetical protein
VEASRFASAQYKPEQIQNYYQQMAGAKNQQAAPKNNVVPMPQQREQQSA